LSRASTLLLALLVLADGTDWNHFFAVADRRAAKSGGRNRVVGPAA
jgi:hypothetical protein